MLAPFWYLNIAAGALAMPMPLWNQTERESRQLSTPTIIYAIKYRQVSQTSVLFKVRHNNGTYSWLDAGWFNETSN